VIPVARIKQHLRITHNAEDTLLTEYEKAAVSYIERRAGMYYGLPKVAEATGTGRYVFLVGPVVSVDTVAGADGGAVEFTREGNVITLARNPFRNAHTVTYTHGAAPEDIPPHIVHAVLMLIAHWYAYRTPVAVATVATEIPHGIEALVPQAPVLA
jgi:uncharacterized phiE125 gp8 family phage protein